MERTSGSPEGDGELVATINYHDKVIIFKVNSHNVIEGVTVCSLFRLHCKTAVSNREYLQSELDLK